MFDKLMQFLKHELTLLSELNNLAEKQKSALVEFRLNDLNNISAHQEELALKLQNAEQQRAGLVMNWLDIPAEDAASMPVTHFKEFIKSEEFPDLQKIQISMKEQIIKLTNINTTNRVLTKRAQRSANQIISIFTNGTNYVCNVKV